LRIMRPQSQPTFRRFNYRITRDGITADIQVHSDPRQLVPPPARRRFVLRQNGQNKAQKERK